MLVRLIPGLILVLVGAVWILQGVDVLKGSPMTGHGQYALLGSVVVLAGAALVVWGLARRHDDG
jgi:hypothetical protein